MADGTGLQFTVRMEKLSASTFAVVEFELKAAHFYGSMRRLL